MASIFGHILASTAIGKSFFPKTNSVRLLLLAGFCAFAPDMDVLGFHFGIPYGSQWGHRGFTHSIVFALVFGSLMAALFYRKHPAFRNIALFLILATLSHPLLDMLTNGGKGIALWWPFSLERIFFPWRPIQVSPLGAGAFFSRWGLRVLASELFWIGFPALFLVALSHFLRKMKEDHD